MDAHERQELLELYADLRVCDVRDGLDAVGYFHYGTLDPNFRPLWRTRAYGIARIEPGDFVAIDLSGLNVGLIGSCNGLAVLTDGAHNIPVAMGGVQIRPGDMIVADGDGVIAVPQEVAREVAYWAHAEHTNDKQERRALYVKAHLELDETV